MKGREIIPWCNHHFKILFDKLPVYVPGPGKSAIAASSRNSCKGTEFYT